MSKTPTRLALVSNDTGNRTEEQEVFEALRDFLEPLIDLFWNFRVTYPTFEEMAKQLYVEKALRARETDEGRDKLPMSHVAFLTGMKPNEIKRYFDPEGPLPEEARKPTSPESRVLEIWTEDEEFLNARGTPKELPITCLLYTSPSPRD